ncbi:MAG: hypothetical protein VYB30_00795 [Candidatus Thermoplasmatota archaeon]|nr:hypothetical protein [Candidatus Thermoplasmatota archaeon]
MSKIPAVKLQQLMGLDEYELTLAIDRVANELGISSEEVQAELDSVDSGSSANQITTPPPVEPPNRKSIFSRNKSESLDDAPTFVSDVSKFRVSYDPSHEGKKRQKQVSQAIVCTNCSVPLGIPEIRPIRVTCPSCGVETTYES